MIRRLVSILLLSSMSGAQALAGPAWTFCVASALGTKDIWITGPFAATAKRERLEEDFKSLLERQGHSRIVAQCPQPSEDRVGVVNAQTTAEEFNRKLGSTLHGVPAHEFPPRD
jgi:hypothetical protein